jgi:photosystem II stability/assembly factor-like uncharacterized protein
MRRLLFSTLALLFAVQPCAVQARAAGAPSRVDSSYFGGLHYRFVGPFRGGRAIAVTGVPGEPNHFYFGAVDGGVWESNDAGRTWNPIFDREPVGSIGAIAVASSNTRVLYVGTGEADMRSDIAYGNGMYKSIDGGRTWTHIGLDDTMQIGSIVVDPKDADTVYVAALGHAYAPNVERGVFKSTDGGAHWTKVLYLNDNTGAIDLAMDPSDSSTLLAAMWQTRRPPWNVYPPSNGPSSGLYITHDAGAHWSRVSQGLPAQVGRIGVSFSAADPSVVYAIVDSDVRHGGIYRSNDGGTTWRRVNGEVRLWQRGWYFGHVTADTQDANTVYVMNTSIYRSTDGGTTFTAIKGDPTGDDYHVLWIDPSDDRRMIHGSDQGVAVSVDRGETWSSWLNQPTAQLYHVATDNRFPYWVYAAQQDSGAIAMPSTGRYATISILDFHPIGACGENGYCAADPLHPGRVYGSGTDPVVVEDVATGWAHNVDGATAYPERLWRLTWTVPLAFSPLDHALYYGHQVVFRSRNGGETWQIVSPDLSRPSTPPLRNLDAATRADNNGLQRHGVVYAIAPSPRAANTIWAGTDDGYVWLTNDGGKHWRNVTPPEVTAWSKIGIIDASHFNAASAYIAVDRHRLNDYRPYIYRTHDGGAHWTRIVDGIRNGDFVNVVREDTVRPGLLYAGTEHGMMISFDDGNHWQSFQLNLPVTSVRDIDVHGDDLVIATHGRGIYILDDVTRLRQMAQALASNGGGYLFTPAAAYRVRKISLGEGGTPLQPDEPQAEDAPVGAIFDYVVRTPGTVNFAVLDAHDRTLRSWSSAQPASAPNPVSLDFMPRWAPAPPVPSSALGAHRFIWNFHTGSNDGPLAPPGTYVVRMTHDGRTYARRFSVLKDPRVGASDADLAAQYDLAEAIEARKAQIAAARKRTHDPRILGVAPVSSPDDSVGAPSRDFTSLRALENAFDTLEQAVESADAAPTPDMRTAYAKLSATLAATLRRIR